MKITLPFGGVIFYISHSKILIISMLSKFVVSLSIPTLLPKRQSCKRLPFFCKFWNLYLYCNLLEKAIDFGGSNCPIFFIKGLWSNIHRPFLFVGGSGQVCARFCSIMGKIRANGGEGLNPGLNFNHFHFEDF